MATSQPAEVRIPIEPRDHYRWQPQDCPICKRPPTKFLGKRGGSAHRTGLGVECDIWRCGQCGLIFPNPMPVPSGGLEQHYGVDSGEYFQHDDCDTKTAYAHFFLKEALALCGKKGRLLDIGAGRGEFLRAAVDDGWEAVGIEPSPQFAKHAAQHSGVAVIPKPIAQCDFEPGTFDVVLLSGVLEHLYHPDDTIREIARVLRKGGALFLDVPNEAGLYFRAGNFYQHLRGRNWVVNLAHFSTVSRVRIYPAVSQISAREAWIDAGEVARVRWSRDGPCVGGTAGKSGTGRGAGRDGFE